MSGSFLFGLIVVPVIAWFYYLDIKAAFGPTRMSIGEENGVGDTSHYQKYL